MNKQIINFTIEGINLIISTHDSVKNVQFPFEVKQVESFETVLIVRLKIPVGTTFNENIFGVSSDGKILWQIKKMKYVYNDSPFTGMVRAGSNIKLCNWDGTDLIVNPETGEIIQEGYSK